MDASVQGAATVLQIFASYDVPLVRFFAGFLEHQGIECHVTNEPVGSLGGDIPLLEGPTELWVLDDSRLEEARQLIEKAALPGVPVNPWRCGKCGELVEGQFTDCWNCGEARGGDSDAPSPS
ncbi:MAG: DUF2007 domain-containing protein [Planctomycetota bacterium]|nr:DUF2007 domain-containing protein [Planctomycetota bacterium]